jgi:microsomal dipeptidase-like Zn-dependent dipeptidase
VTIGSDFDGATIPTAIKDASGLPNLTAALWSSGFNKDSMRKIAFDNSMRLFDSLDGSILPQRWAIGRIKPFPVRSLDFDA